MDKFMKYGKLHRPHSKIFRPKEFHPVYNHSHEQSSDIIGAHVVHKSEINDHAEKHVHWKHHTDKRMKFGATIGLEIINPNIHNSP